MPGGPITLAGNSVGILLLHGYTATTAEVRFLAGFLNAQGYTVHAPLLPGHGTTQLDLNSKNRSDWIAAVEAAYLALRAEVETVFIGGESMGAVLCLELATRYPEIAGLMLYAPAIAVQLNRFERFGAGLYANIRMSVPKRNIDVPDQWQGYPDNPMRAAVQLFKLQDDVRKKLPKVTQPIKIFQGRLDTAIDPNSGAIIMNGVSSVDVQLYWMEESSHVILIDKEWEKVAEMTLAFIQYFVGPVE